MATHLVWELARFGYDAKAMLVFVVVLVVF